MVSTFQKFSFYAVGTLALLALSGIVATKAHALIPYTPVDQKSSETQNDSSLSAFRMMILVGHPNVIVPTVVEVDIPDALVDNRQFAVLEEQTGMFISNYFRQEFKQKPVSITVDSDATVRGGLLVDDDRDTSVDFLLPNDGTDLGTLELTFTGEKAFYSSGMTFDLARNVALPTSVEIRAVLDTGVEEIIVAKKKMRGRTVAFPKTKASVWRVVFTYAQPLRLNEVRVTQDDVEAEAVRGLRFLAQPDKSYVLYYEADRAVSIRTTEGGDLHNDEDVRILQAMTSVRNPLYKEADVDSDGIPDSIDNCVTVANMYQKDVNGNGRGDVCEDFDRDGVANHLDNCPNDPNKYQRDEDGDTIGDVCDDEESRITEKHAWIPWVGIGFAGLVLVVMFAVVARRPTVVEVADSDSQEGGV